MSTAIKWFYILLLEYYVTRIEPLVCCPTGASSYRSGVDYVIEMTMHQVRNYLYTGHQRKSLDFFRNEELGSELF